MLFALTPNVVRSSKSREEVERRRREQMTIDAIQDAPCPEMRPSCPYARAALEQRLKKVAAIPAAARRAPSRAGNRRDVRKHARRCDGAEERHDCETA